MTLFGIRFANGVIAACLAQGLLLGAAAAQNAAPGAAGQQMGAVDANADGAIDRAEMRAARGEAFDKLDANRDRKLSHAEMEAARDQVYAEWAQRNPNEAAAGKRPTLDLDVFFKTNDKNGDGVVTREEFLAAGDERLARLDRNKDGRITRDEVTRRAAPQQQAPQQQAPQQGR